jgi:hypothetical protein
MEQSRCDVAGLRKGYFWRNPELLTYTYPDTENVLLGATMCHTKEYWQRNAYKHVQVGYDVQFTSGNCNVGDLKYTDGFIATIHSGNVSPKNTTGERWATVENIPTSVHNLLIQFPLGS